MKKIENRICVLIWTGIFLLETIICLIDLIIDRNTTLEIKPFLQVWLTTLPFCIICLIHNFWIGPILTIKGRFGKYLIFTAVLYGLFSIVIFNSFPTKTDFPNHPADAAVRPALPPQMDLEMTPVPPAPPEIAQQQPPQGPPQMSPQEPYGSVKRIFRPIKPSFLMMILGLLTLGADLGYLFYMKTLQERRRIEDLERENLRYRLDYLRFQINPHFFMNTLNNIHALVDIDSEKAKDSIVELSKLMRYVLYQQNTTVVPLSVELDFLNHYIKLMRLRFKDQVQISNTISDSVQNAEIPPMILTTLAENAFKHGISYNADSFVRIDTTVENDRIVFRCSNSLFKETEDNVHQEHGIGLDNVRSRLELIYGQDFVMKTTSSEGIYELLLVAPTHLKDLKI